MKLIAAVTPHKLPIVYLAFRSGSYEEFSSLIKKYCIEYTFPDEKDRKDTFYRIINSMPVEAKRWHQSKTRLADKVPTSVIEWANRIGIGNFVDNLYMRSCSDQDFVAAWGIFQKYSIRRMTEALLINQLTSMEIVSHVRALRAIVTVSSIDIFSREMFDLSVFDTESDIVDWVSSIKASGAKNIGYTADARGKEYALLHPVNPVGVIMEFDVMPLLGKTDMIEIAMRQSFRKSMEVIKDDDMGVDDPDNPNHEKFKTYSGALYKGMEVLGMSASKNAGKSIEDRSQLSWEEHADNIIDADTLGQDVVNGTAPKQLETKQVKKGEKEN
jgi:hypothetical protein